jgi:hypothetical protein
MKSVSSSFFETREIDRVMLSRRRIERRNLPVGVAHLHAGHVAQKRGRLHLSATNFLGCSTKVLEERYGTWDLFSQVEVVNALTKAVKQKAAAVQLMEDGLVAA